MKVNELIDLLEAARIAHGERATWNAIIHTKDAVDFINQTDAIKRAIEAIRTLQEIATGYEWSGNDCRTTASNWINSLEAK